MLSGKIDRAGPDGGQIQDQGRHRLLDLDRDPVTGFDPAGGEHVGQPARQGDQVGIADGLTGRRGDGSAGEVGNRAFEPIKQVGVHGNGSEARVDDRPGQTEWERCGHGAGTRSREGRSVRKALRTAGDAATAPFSAKASWFFSISSRA